ncbi:MAG: hemerythrin family protein [Candidatus Schekmanbacteria bacterium]|nr:hemerythrin family protein [Candidatus Schekmanbacteria bacterium]
MTLLWLPEYAVDVSSIDAQHRELFDRINELRGAMRSGKGREALEKTMEFLRSYIVTHFRHEERLMVASAYPGMPAHLAAHREFETQLAELESRVRRSGSTVDAVIANNHLLSSWWIAHIRGLDVGFGKFLVARQAFEKPGVLPEVAVH